MLVLAGSTDVTTYFQLRNLDGTDATGKTISDFDMQYTRSGVAPTAKVDAVALAAADTAHTDNRGFEIDGTDQPGVYRFDWPDAAFAAGVREVIVTIKHVECLTESIRVQLTGFDVGAAVIPANVTQFGGSNGSFASGRPEVNSTHWGGTAVASANVLIDGAITDAKVADGFLTAAKFASGAFNAVWSVATRLLTAGTNIVLAKGTGVTGFNDISSADAQAAAEAALAAQTDPLPANIEQIGGDATSAANLAKTTRAIGRGTVDSGASTTSVPTSAFAPAGAAEDQFKGRIITFDADTSTAALRGQSTDITASSDDAAPSFTVTALTTAPSSGDTFSVT
jgi:hypothetical protein